MSQKIKLNENKICEVALNLFKELNKNNINYCHFKSNAHIDDSIYWETDFDIIVDEENFNKFKDIIKLFKFKEVISQPWSKYKNVYDFVWLDEKTWKIIHLHTHLKIVTGTKFVKEYIIPFWKLFLNKNYQTNIFDIKVPKKELEFLLLIFRIWLKTSNKQINKNILPENIEEEILYLKDLNKEILYKLIKKNISVNNQDFIKKISNNILNWKIIWSDLKKLKKIIKKELKNYKTTNFIFLKKFFYKYYEIFRAINFRILKRYSHHKKNFKNWWFSVTILWPDWAWKSTIIKQLQKDFLYKINTQTFYLWTWDWEKNISLLLFQKLLKFAWIWQKENNWKNKKDNNINNEVKSKWLIYDTIAWFYYYLISKDKKDKIKNILNHKRHWVLCLIDRFPQEQFCWINDWISCFNKNKIKTKWFLSKYFFKKEKQNYNFCLQNQPDLIIKLKIDSKTAYNRKKDYDKSHNLKNIEEKIKIIENLKFNTETIEIDAKLPLKKVILNIKNQIWKRL